MNLKNSCQQELSMGHVGSITGGELSKRRRTPNGTCWECRENRSQKLIVSVQEFKFKFKLPTCELSLKRGRVVMKSSRDFTFYCLDLNRIQKTNLSYSPNAETQLWQIKETHF